VGLDPPEHALSIERPTTERSMPGNPTVPRYFTINRPGGLKTPQVFLEAADFLFGEEPVLVERFLKFPDKSVGQVFQRGLMDSPHKLLETFPARRW